MTRRWILLACLGACVAALLWSLASGLEDARAPGAGVEAQRGSEPAPDPLLERADLASDLERRLADDVFSCYASSAREHAPANAELLRGTVRDANGQPVAGARVELWNARGRWIELVVPGSEVGPRVVEARTATDVRGRFTFFVAPQSAFTLVAHGDDSVVLARATPGGVGDLTLAPCASIRGRVTRQRDGRAVERARVRACRRLDPADESSRLVATHELVTRSDGAFSWTCLAPGAWTVVVDHAEHVARTEQVHIDAGVARDLEFALPDGRALRGTLRDLTTSAPASGARVSVSGVPSKSVTTGADGSYVLSGLSAGDVVVVEFPGRARAVMRLYERMLGGWDRSDLALSAGSRASGRIVDAAGQPVPGAQLTVLVSPPFGEYRSFDFEDLPRAHAVSFDARADEHGSFELDGLDESTLSAVFARECTAGVALAFVSDPPADGRGDRAREDRSRALGDLVLHPGTTLRVHVFEEERQPAAGVDVILETSPEFAGATERTIDAPVIFIGDRGVRDHEPAIVLAAGRTDEHGVFEVANVPAGRYCARAVRELDRDDEASFPSALFDLTSEVPQHDVELEIPPLLLVRGTVLDPWGNALPRAAVNWNTTERPFLTDEHGAFEFRFVTRAPITLYGSWPEREYSLGGQRTVLGTAVEPGVVPGGPPIVLRLPRILPIRGRVLRGDEPAERIGVQARDGRDAIVDVDFCASDGTFEVMAPEGTLLALTLHKNVGEGSVMRISGHAPPLARFDDITAGATGLELRLPAARSIRGRVVKHGVPVFGVGVRALDALGEVVDTDFTEKDGAFELAVLEGASHTLTVHENRTGWKQSTFSIRGDEAPIARVTGVDSGRTDVVIALPD